MDNTSSQQCFNAESVHIDEAVSIVNIVLGVAGIVVTAVVLIMMALLDKHHSHTYRLIMYLNVGIMIQGLASALGFNSILAGNNLSLYYSTYCSLLGFLNMYAIFTQLVLIGWIMIDVFLKTALDLYTKSAFEVIQVLSAFVGPALLLWIPLLPTIDAYGGQGALCAIKIIDYTNCTQHMAGFVVSTAICAIQILALVISVILYAITIAKLNVQQKKSRCESVCQNHIQHEIDQLRKRTHRLVLYPIIFFLFSLPGWIEIYLQYSIPGQETNLLIPIVIQVVCLNLRGIVISITFSFMANVWTTLVLSPRHLHQCTKCCRKRKNSHVTAEARFQSPYLLTSTGSNLHKITDSLARGPKLQVHDIT